MEYFSDSRLAGRQVRDVPQGEAGLTLIEMMVVIVIIAILASAVMLSGIMDRPDQAKAVTTKQNMATIVAALKTYRLDNGVYPTDEQGLKALTEQPTTAPVPQNWVKGGYLSAPAQDAWEHPLKYSTTPEGFVLKSLGRDGKEGGEGIDADIEVKG